MSSVMDNIIQKRINAKQANQILKPRKASELHNRSKSTTLAGISRVQVQGSFVDDVGGKRIPIDTTSEYSVYSFYMTPSSSTGRRRIKEGSKTFLLMSGTVFVSLETKEYKKRESLRAGEKLTVQKGTLYEISTGNFPAEFFTVESAKISEKTDTGAVVTDSGLAVYHNIRNEDQNTLENIKPHRIRSAEERAALGAKVMMAQGSVSPQDKNILRRNIIRGTHDPNQIVQKVINNDVAAVNADLDRNFSAQQGVNIPSIGDRLAAMDGVEA